MEREELDSRTDFKLKLRKAAVDQNEQQLQHQVSVMVMILSKFDPKESEI